MICVTQNLISSVTLIAETILLMSTKSLAGNVRRNGSHETERTQIANTVFCVPHHPVFVDKHLFSVLYWLKSIIQQVHLTLNSPASNFGEIWYFNVDRQVRFMFSEAKNTLVYIFLLHFDLRIGLRVHLLSKDLY